MIYLIARTILRMSFSVFFRLQAYGLGHIPAAGPVIICANHLSNWDPPLLGTPLKRKVHYMAKAELFRVPVLGWLITRLGAFPVKRGGVSKESIRLALQMLAEGQVLGIFPQGSRGASIGKKGAASFAVKSKATVIPAAIVGDYRLFRRMIIEYGEPLDLSAFAEGTSEQLEAATDKIMAEIQRLAAKHARKN